MWRPCCRLWCRWLSLWQPAVPPVDAGSSHWQHLSVLVFIYTLRILIVLISINATPRDVHWGWGCWCDDYVVAYGTTGCPCDSLCCHRWVRDHHTDSTSLCSSVYILRIYMPSDRGQGRHVYVIYVLFYYYQWLIGWSSLFRLIGCRCDDHVVNSGAAGCLCDNLRCHGLIRDRRIDSNSLFWYS